MTQPNGNWGGQSLCKPTREGTAAGPRAGNSIEQLTALPLKPWGGRRRGGLTGANPANLQPPGREGGSRGIVTSASSLLQISRCTSHRGLSSAGAGRGGSLLIGPTEYRAHGGWRVELEGPTMRSGPAFKSPFTCISLTCLYTDVLFDYQLGSGGRARRDDRGFGGGALSLLL